MMKPCMDCGSTDGIHGSNCATHEREPVLDKPAMLKLLAINLDDWPKSSDKRTDPTGWGWRWLSLPPDGEIVLGADETLGAEWRITEREWREVRDTALDKPSWADAPEWAEWLAQDKDGDWFWFECEPEAQFGEWCSDAGQLGEAGSGMRHLGPAWQQTLERRPDDSFTVEPAPLSQAKQEEFDASMRVFTEDAFPKQARYQDAGGEDWIDEFARTATPEEFRGAMRFTIGKYNRRAGKKDALVSEITKIEDYARRWREYELARGGDQ